MKYLMKRTLVLLTLLLVVSLMTACGSDDSDENMEKTTAVGEEGTEKETPAETKAPEATTEAVTEAADKETDAAFGEGYVAYNAKLSDWYRSYYKRVHSLESYTGDRGPATDMVMINYSETRKSMDGEEVADGGMTSLGGTFSIGVGSGVDNEELWYATLTFPADIDEQVMEINTLMAVAACQAVGIDFGDDDEIIYTLAGFLCYSEGDAAVEIGDLVLATKILSGGQRLVMFDSLDFYNGFYAGSIEDYTVLTGE